MTNSRRSIDDRHPLPAPLEFAGQWVAWNQARTEIVAHGETFADVQRAAQAAGHSQPVLQRVRRRNETFIGAA